MAETESGALDPTAERVALWRALHVELDSPPHVLDDEIGLRLAGPDPAWRQRPDMDPDFTRGMRASIVGRARFIEDLVEQRTADGVTQYVLLGAGLDTFAQRRADLARERGLTVFEIDQPGPQAWKARRLTQLGYGVPDWLRLVPVNFETDLWQDRLRSAGFDLARPAVVASTGVSMYLSGEANAATLRQLARLAPGSAVAMTFLLPIELLDEQDRPGLEIAMRGAGASGTPFISFYAPEEMTGLAVASGFAAAEHVSSAQLNDRYFANRPDALRISTGEDILLART